jgi:alcohol dehydrogenase YqhD (iron-dependent ADH family)
VTTTFYIPTKIIFGAGGLSQLGAEVSGLGKKAVIVTGRGSIRRLGVLDRVLADLEANGVSAVIFERVEPNPRADTVDEGAGLVKYEGADVVIALGGGSVMDAAKGIALAAAGDKSVWHYIVNGDDPPGRVPPLIMVPTVAASGSESNGGAVITDWQSHEKRVLFRHSLYPTVSIVDPDLTLSLPAKQTAEGGVDIFCHLVEPYLTTEGEAPLTDGLVETALKMVIKYLPQALANLNDIEARTQLSWASTIACSNFASLGGGGGSMTLHGIEHPVSGFYDIPHGAGLAALLPAWMEYTGPIREERFKKLAENVFGGTEAIAAVKDWLKKVNMGFNLGDLGIEEAKLGEMAASALVVSPWLRAHPRKLEEPEITRIFENSL